MELSVSACALGMRPGCCDNVRALGATSVFRVFAIVGSNNISREKGGDEQKERNGQPRVSGQNICFRMSSKASDSHLSCILYTATAIIYHDRPIATTSKPTDLEPLDALNPIHHEQQRQQPPRDGGSDHDPHKLAYRPVFNPVER